jgi:3-oxoacyl-[acyl-carrier-protein] synthase-1
MATIAGTNIISSLGFTTRENFENVKRGISGVKPYKSGVFDLPEAFIASLIDREQLNDTFSDFYRYYPIKLEYPQSMYSEVERAAILSICYANLEAKIDLSSSRTVFILSTTKGNIHLLENNENEHIHLWYTAKLIASFFKNRNTPIVVSNACISGACAQTAAVRELQSGKYDYTVLVGVDFLSKFIISGFQSFKALSPELCKPFDKNRCGLNLGEAVATMILIRQNSLREDLQKVPTKSVELVMDAICNDANHISAPSRTGEGSYRALSRLLSGDSNLESGNLKSQIAFINAHGTATPYNDAMESIAINRAGLNETPVNSLKPFFGHTLGAAGLLESIISMRALEDGIILPSLNFTESEELLFDNNPITINISSKIQETDKRYFIKMLSGFGGCNAALLFVKNDSEQIDIKSNTRNDTRKSAENFKFQISNSQISSLYIKKYCNLHFKSMTEIVEAYRNLKIDYPKFFKMDGLSKLGFLASEIIFANEENRFVPREDVAVIFFNRSSSLDVDIQYQATIRNNDSYFPSPSLFVYTLPNIVTGEIAIRNKFLGETSLYVSEKFDAEQMFETVRNAFSDTAINIILTAWIECYNGTFEVFMLLVDKHSKESIIFTENNVNNLFKN